MSQDGFLDNVNARGEQMRQGLEKLKEKYVPQSQVRALAAN